MKPFQLIRVNLPIHWDSAIADRMRLAAIEFVQFLAKLWRNAQTYGHPHKCYGRRGFGGRCDFIRNENSRSFAKLKCAARVRLPMAIEQMTVEIRLAL